MKLDNFSYKISARADGQVYHVYAENDGAGHEFIAHHAGNMWVVVSAEISDMYEAGDYVPAENLRTKLLSLFMTHYAAIKRATKYTTEAIDVALL